jgi:hypothetical protein
MDAMMRALLLGLACLVCLAFAAPALALDKPQPDAAALLGKTLSPDKQSAIADHAVMAKSGAWTFGLTYDDTGLERMANADERGGGAALTVAQIYSKRCDRAASPSFAFGGDERFVLKGETGSRVADAWLFFAKGDAFDGAGRKVRLEMSENDGALYTKLDPTELAANATLAICPTAKAPGSGKMKCSQFDLAGFARAYDYVCDAK